MSGRSGAFALALLTGLGVTLGGPSDAEACSVEYDEVEAPSVVHPYDADLAPAPPQPSAARIQDSDSALLLCSPCASQPSLRIEFSERPGTGLVRLQLGERVVYARPSGSDVLLSWPERVEGPVEILVEAIDGDGYPSAAVAVEVDDERDDGGCRVGRWSGAPVPVVIVLAVGWIRSRRRSR